MLDGKHQPAQGVLALHSFVGAEEHQTGVLQGILGVGGAGGVPLGLAAQRRSVGIEKLGEDAGAGL